MTAAVLAFGAWLKNTACRLDAAPGAQPVWSDLHGDLGDPEACARLARSVQALRDAVARDGGHIAAVAHDLHPDFYSTQLALQTATQLGVPAIGVQHHHAHIATVCAEHGISRPVIGLALDGVGLGTDGQAWGGELLHVDGARMQRLGHLQPLALPGGDAAAREPWRMAAAALHALGRGEGIAPLFTPVVGAALARGVAQMLARGLNCPPTTSTGRWFDAAAGALGLSVRQAHEAQAAIALQQAAQDWLATHAAQAPMEPPAAIDTTAAVLDLRGVLATLFDARARGEPPGRVAAWFHHTLADALADWAAAAASTHALADVCLGGGCFLNPLLTQRVTARLQARGLRTHLPRRHTCGDGALALGQAWVACRVLACGAPAPLDAVAFPFAKEHAPCA